MRAVIFTYPEDYGMAAVAARALIRTGVEPRLAIDAKDPWPVIEGVKVVRTRFPRGRNLNGKPCVIGVLETLSEAADHNPYVLKVDSDTVVRGLGWLDGMTAAAVGLRHKGVREFYGACYALRTVRLPEYLSRAHALRPKGRYPEDETIGGMLDLYTYENRTPGCPFSAYDWKHGVPAGNEVAIFQRTEGRGRREVRAAMQDLP